MDFIVESTKIKSWQEFEEFVKKVFESHGFLTKFRVVFKYESTKSEIDVVAKKGNIVLAVDAKRYTKSWYRVSALKREAKKHAKRCEKYSKTIGKKVIPLIVCLIDDEVIEHCGCIIVPLRGLNDFLLNLEGYLLDFGYF